MTKLGKKLFSVGKEVSGLKAIPFTTKLFINSFKFFSYRNLGFPKILPKMAVMSITNKCNSACKVCSIWKYYHKNKDKIKEEMNFDEFKRFIDNNPQLEDVKLTGGEIFLKDELVDIWSYLDEKGFRTGGATNAVDIDLIKKKTNQALERLSGNNAHFLHVSIDGIEEENDRIRGIKGNFKNAINLIKWGIEKKKEYKFLELAVSHNITRTNYKNFLNFIDYFVDFGLKPNQISFRPVRISTRFNNGESEEVFKNQSEYEEVIKIIKEVQEKYKYFKQGYFFKKIPDYLKNPNKLIVPCYAGYNFIYVDPFWNVYPCMEMNSKAGNLRNYDFELKQIINTKRFKEIKGEIKKGNCPNCWNACSSIPSMLSDPIQLSKFCYHDLYRLFK